MSAEIKKEIELEIAHVLFIDIVGYSKLSINDQHAAVEELNRIVRASEQFQRAEAASRLIRIPTGDGMVLVFTPIRKRLRSARWRLAARSRNIRACKFGWESTAGQLAAWSM
jgi:hypothetical protein